MTGLVLEPELLFVAACCRWPDDQQRRSRISAAADAVGDWDRMAELAEAHRVEGLVDQALAAAAVDIPAATAARLNHGAEEIRALSLVQLMEMLRIARRLAQRGIDHRFLKGIPLGLVVYGSPTLKRSWDIDVLVSRGDAVATARELAELGYAPQNPARPLDEAEFERFSVVQKEAEFANVDGVSVELHWGIADHPMLLKGLDPFRAPRQVALLGERSVATLPDDANIYYLAVHGAPHGWSRLKWLADFSGLLAAHTREDRIALCRDAGRYGAAPAVEQGLLLADHLFGPGIVPAELLASASSSARRLADLALAVIARREHDGEIEADRIARSALLKSNWLLGSGYRYLALHAVNRLRGSEERRQVALPKGLHWLYWVIRPFMWLGRRARRGW